MPIFSVAQNIRLPESQDHQSPAHISADGTPGKALPQMRRLPGSTGKFFPNPNFHSLQNAEESTSPEEQ
jgi:hypothetical protein